MLIVADARRLPLRDGCVQCAITSPPYWGLRDYGTARWEGGDPACDHNARTGDLRFTHPISDKQRSNAGSAGSAGSAGTNCKHCGAVRVDQQIGLERTPDEYVESIVTVFREIRRVLVDDGTAWLNLGDTYATGAGSVGEHPGGGAQGARWRGGPPSDKSTLQGNGHIGGGPKLKSLPPVPVGRGVHTVENSGKSAPRIAAMGPMTQPNRMPIEGLKPKDLVGIPWRVAFALQADGWYLRSDIVWAKPNPMPESVTDRPTKSHEYLFLLAKSERYHYDAEAIKEEGAGRLDRGDMNFGARLNSGAEWTGCTYRSGNKARKLGDERDRPGSHLGASIPWEGSTRNKRTVWTVPTQPFAGAHFATFPEALVEPCILAGCPVGGLVLDPFLGSGTVGVVAERLSRRWVGTDLGYQPLAQARTAQRGIRW